MSATCEPCNDFCLTSGDLVMDLHTRTVACSNCPVFLSNKEFQLLEYLMRNSQRVLTRMEIYENVWDRNAMILTNTIDVHIMNLRRKIDLPFGKGLIRTVHCVGYCFG